MKIDKPYYVASDSVVRDERQWRHGTLDEATEHAAGLMAENDHKHTIFIVKVVRVVKRKPVKVKVQDVD